jgi:hypothetical protein
VERRSRLIVQMRRALQCSTVAAMVALALVTASAQSPAIPDHVREELGINEYTTPSIAVLLKALETLRPVPFEEVERPVPQQNPGDRVRLALSTGGIIADGFLAVVAEKQSRIEPIARALLRQAKGLGVGEHVTRHSRSVLEKALVKDWNGIRTELVGTQRDVEAGMMALRDEEIAHLVALGGWWRGLEITSGILSSHYSQQGAALLVQPAVIDYFADRVSTLNPSFAKTKLWVALSENLSAVRKIACKPDGTPPTQEEVRAIRVLAGAMNNLIAAPEE